METRVVCFWVVTQKTGADVFQNSWKCMWCVCGWLQWKVGVVYLWVVTMESGWGVFVCGYHRKWVGWICGWLQWKMGGVCFRVVTVWDICGWLQWKLSVVCLRMGSVESRCVFVGDLSGKWAWCVWVVTEVSGCGMFMDGISGKCVWCVWVGSVESGYIVFWSDDCGSLVRCVLEWWLWKPGEVRCVLEWWLWKHGVVCFGVMTGSMVQRVWCGVFWSDDCGSLLRCVQVQQVLQVLGCSPSTRWTSAPTICPRHTHGTSTHPFLSLHAYPMSAYQFLVE